MHEDAPHRSHDRFGWFALAAGILAAVSVTLHALANGFDSLATLALVGVSVFSSKLFIFQGVFEGHPFSPWSLALISWELDLCVSALLLMWFAEIERLPLAGPALRQAHARAARTLERLPGLRRLAVGGVTLFVFLPLPGSGSVTGTLIGQLLGLSRPMGYMIVAVGTGVAIVVYAAVATYLGEKGLELLQRPETLLVSLLGLGTFLWVAWRYVKRALSQA